MRTSIAAIVVMFFANAMYAATPEANPEASVPTFRVTTAEIHLTLTAVRGKNHPVTDLSQADFVVMQDGTPVDRIVSFGSYHHSPLSTLVLTDVSDSMLKGLPLERVGTAWLRTNSDSSSDQLSFLDFGDEIETGSNSKSVNHHLTSLYDALIETLSRFAADHDGRRALILLTDGADNYSYHSLGDVIELAQRLDIAVYAITAHPNKKQYYRPDLLQKLCDETGGNYYDVRKLDEMMRAMSEINDELRNGYELVFRPGPTSAGIHRLKIRSQQRDMRFFYRSAYFRPLPSTDEVASTR